MTKEKATFNVTTAIKTALISGIFSSTFGFLYNISIKFFLEAKGNLVYETPTITYFNENVNKFSVGNVNIRNIGNNVVENISFSVSQKGIVKNLRCTYVQSSFLIKVIPDSIKVDTVENNTYNVQFLNPTETIRFQFKVSNYVKSEDFVIDLRGKNFVGYELKGEQKINNLNRFYLILIFFIVTIMLVAIFGLYGKIQKLKEFGKLTEIAPDEKAEQT